MEIFRGTSAQMLELWNGRFASFVNSHVAAVNSGVQECWLMRNEEADRLIGELHILWDKPDDPDYADGRTKAYLLAFRIDPAYQGRGLGTMLMKRVLERVRERGFTAATIGADDYDPKLQLMYKKWGFTEAIKTDSFQYLHQGKQVICTFTLLQNSNLEV